MIFSRPGPVLTPEDLGLELEEDSEDFTEEEAASATDTDSVEDFASKVKDFVSGGVPQFELRRRAGILYSRVSLQEGASRSFRVDWLRRRS